MMAVDLHSTELLLPSHFLYDEEEDVLPKNLKSSKVHEESSYYNPWEAPHGTESAFSSPVESELGSGSGSTESESDKDDDYIAELTRQMAHSMLQDDDKNSIPCNGKMDKKTWGSAGSPQSTLWSPLGFGSPDGPSKEPSPPPSPELAEDPFWDSSYDAVGRLEKMNLNDCEKPIFQNIGLCSNQALTDHQLRAIEFYRLKQERLMKQQGSSNWERRANVSQLSEPKEQPLQFPKKGRFCSGSGDGGKAWTDPWTQTQTQTQPQAQCHQQAGSGMRAFVLGGDSGNGSCGTGGTGVFLPRGVWYSSESRKKPGCSSVFIPERVAQALKLHFDQMGTLSRSNAAACPLPHDGLMGRRSNGLNSKQKRQSRTVPAMSMNCHEMGLPQEWTY